MDLVYIVRLGDHNEELRYSLRSVAKNLPHNRIFIVGYMPSWVRGCIHISTEQLKNDTTQETHLNPSNSEILITTSQPQHDAMRRYNFKLVDSRLLRGAFVNTSLSLIRACTEPEISDDFILMNDDFFIRKPLKSPGNWHRGPIHEVVGSHGEKNSDYLENMKRTDKFLRSKGIKNPLCYELHIPMVVNKQKMLECLSIIPPGEHLSSYSKRTLYGNYHKLGGRRMDDVKISTSEEVPLPSGAFVSSKLSSFNSHLGDIIRAEFKEPCQYENKE